MSERPMITLHRRQFLLAASATAVAPVLVGCGKKDHVVSLDRHFPIGTYGAESTAEEVTEGLDLSGKVALVTGCNSGLGYETMRVLALRGAHVIGAARTMDKAVKACNSVVGTTTPVALELTDYPSVIDCAATVAAMGVPLDILFCNAGAIYFNGLELVDGVERIFVNNYLGHFILVDHLLPLLKSAPAGRIVFVGSRAGYRQVPEGIDFDNLRGEGEFDSVKAYGRTKLAMALHSLELSRRLADTTVTSNVIHPGVVKTNVFRYAPWYVRFPHDIGLVPGMKQVDAGAATQVYVATNPTLAGVRGGYFEDCNPVEISGPNHVFDADMASELWRVSVDLTQGYLS